ncbi:hypothetical protein [Comamonas odontotermitis]|uniref:hypothetical protein n=1 Tax=Comamonas odontotermitis TaxID=379895 RepID=UPI001CC5E89E|nr:hypothetical protein [Comamonas odontotermitis]UBB15420.1 hypothetical protein LAD35_11095 [Comamonas odontotermitis]
MPNTSYPKGMEKLLSAQINLLNDDLRVALLPPTYTYSVAHEFLSNLGTRIGTDMVLANKDVTGGVFDADDVATDPLPPGNTAKSVAIYKNTGNASTSPLLFFFDTVTGLPMATNGGAINFPWNDGPDKIAVLNDPFIPSGGELVMKAGVNFLTDTLKVAMLPATFDHEGTYQNLADLGEIIGTPVELTGKSITGGVFDATDVDFGTVPAGKSPGSVALYRQGADAATSPVLQIIKDDIMGLPFAGNGGGFKLRWSDGNAKIFSLIPA